jgi:hypothetical protein
MIRTKDFDGEQLQHTDQVPHRMSDALPAQLTHRVISLTLNMSSSQEEPILTIVKLVQRAAKNPSQSDLVKLYLLLNTLSLVRFRGNVHDCESHGNVIGYLTEPCVLITEDDVVVGWYLPGLLSASLLVCTYLRFPCLNLIDYQTQLDTATTHIESLCAKQVEPKPNASWRRAAEAHLAPDSSTRTAGTANFSPGYFDLSGVGQRITNIGP